MDRTLYNASGCKDKTAHDAICSASKPQTQVFRSDWTRRDNEADMFVKMVKRLAKGFNFKLCDRFDLRIRKQERNICEVWHGHREKSTIRSTDKRGN